MKLEHLASLLEKDATELVSTLNLQEGSQEVEDETAVKAISGFIKDYGLGKLSEGKKQGEGMAKRLVSSEIEKRIKALGFEGESMDDLISSIEASKKNAPDESKFKTQIELWKNKATTLEADLQKEREFVTQFKTRSKVEQAIMPLLSNFEFATDKVKSLAIDEFVRAHKFQDVDGMLIVEVDGKPTAAIDKIAEKHLSEFGKLKQTNQAPKPHFPGPGKGNVGADTLKELYEMHRKATTPQEKAQILDKIKAIEAVEA